ncbi:MAG: hypothetical protein LBH95_03645 [Oscillospiraceae bacterium]|jgi:hypothetical protein|nr:hypothetical protein [Oscillospiraceae bacterium]
MKRYAAPVMLLCLALGCVTGCSGNGTPQGGGRESPGINGGAQGRAVDVDLTVLSSVMVYAEVYNIMTRPEDYMGKTIKMSGLYYASYYDKTGLYYHYVVIEDATACCQQGMEFIWNGRHSYPEDYPADETIVEMSGVFGRYEELGQTYYYLAVDEIAV